MCCYSDPKAKREFLKSLGKRKTFVAWKVLWKAPNGKQLKALYVDYTFRPGANKTKQMARYSLKNPSGFHVYLDKSEAKMQSTVYESISPVVCRAEDLWRVDGNGQAVVRNQIIIRKKDYERALG